MIDWSVRVGDLLVLGGFIGTAFLYAFKSGQFAETINMMQREIEELKDTAKAISGAITTIAVQKNQIERIEQDIVDLKHGRGFVIGDRRKTIEGEY